MKYMALVFALSVLFIYEKVWRYKICCKKIAEHIKAIGGDLHQIEKISARDEIYAVYYKQNDNSIQTTVIFDFFYKETWK